MLKSANAVDLRVEQATAKEMSAIGTKRTCAGAPHMSAIGGKADMTFCAAHCLLFT
jgi:hypothetical protein